VGGAQHPQQIRCTIGEEIDDRAGVGVGGGLADPEPGGDLPKVVVSRRYTSATIAR
jgi:hypothetical protein